MTAVSVLPLGIFGGYGGANSVAALARSMDVSGPLLQQAGGIASHMVSIGVGIASIFLLIVVFGYVTSILDGGKFELKMLKPLLIYLVVANFNLVSYPVTGFIRTLQRSVNESCSNSKMDILASVAGVSSSDPNAPVNAWQAFMSKQSVANGVENNRFEKEDARYQGTDDPVEDSDEDGSTTAPDSERKGGFLKNVGENIGQALSKRWDSVMIKFAQDWSTVEKGFNYAGMWYKHGWAFLACTVVQWICSLMTIVYTCFGAVLMSLMVAFGPLTFAFAILPGSSNAIKSWFIRLCQYSLYSPLVAIVDAFNVVILKTFLDVPYGANMLSVMALLVCNIVCLASVPTLASMIIEGASGSMSLSGAMSSAWNTVTSPLRELSHLVGLGEGSRDRQAMGKQDQTNDYLKKIGEHLGADMGGDSAAGQNPNK